MQYINTVCLFQSQSDFHRPIYSPCDIHTPVGHRHNANMFQA